MLLPMDDPEHTQRDTTSRFQLRRVSGQPVSDAEILADLSNVATKLSATTVSMPQYKQYGQYDGRNVARRFGSWNNALLAGGLTLSNEIDLSDAFIAYANATGVDAPACRDDTDGKHATGRHPSLRLRWKVLQRDRFTCRGCGRSPALVPGVELHVDHIEPWGKGGQTILENLQTLCLTCNLGKSDLPT